MTHEELFKKLTHDIPMTRHLGFQILEASATKVHLRADLTENINHKGTAFGGSLYALGVLSAYSLVYLGLEAEGIRTNNIVIQKGDMQYLKPVDADFDIVCEFNEPTIYEKFFAGLRRWKKMREVMRVQIFCKGQLCAKLEGTFVVHLESRTQSPTREI